MFHYLHVVLSCICFHTLQIAEKIVLENRVKKEPDSPSRQASITLNATSEFCRALGDIPTYGQAGNRDEIERDELAVSGLDFFFQLAGLVSAVGSVSSLAFRSSQV